MTLLNNRKVTTRISQVSDSDSVLNTNSNLKGPKVSEWLSAFEAALASHQLNHGGLTTQEIIDLTGVSIRQVRRELKILISARKVACIRGYRIDITGHKHHVPTYVLTKGSK